MFTSRQQNTGRSRSINMTIKLFGNKEKFWYFRMTVTNLMAIHVGIKRRLKLRNKCYR
jgi:hypothetical protein